MCLIWKRYLKPNSWIQPVPNPTLGLGQIQLVVRRYNIAVLAADIKNHLNPWTRLSDGQITKVGELEHSKVPRVLTLTFLTFIGWESHMWRLQHAQVLPNPVS